MKKIGLLALASLSLFSLVSCKGNDYDVTIIEDLNFGEKLEEEEANEIVENVLNKSNELSGGSFKGSVYYLYSDGKEIKAETEGYVTLYENYGYRYDAAVKTYGEDGITNTSRMELSFLDDDTHSKITINSTSSDETIVNRDILDIDDYNYDKENFHRSLLGSFINIYYYNYTYSIFKKDDGYIFENTYISEEIRKQYMVVVNSNYEVEKVTIINERYGKKNEQDKTSDEMILLESNEACLYLTYGDKKTMSKDDISEFEKPILHRVGVILINNDIDLRLENSNNTKLELNKCHIVAYGNVEANNSYNAELTFSYYDNYSRFYDSVLLTIDSSNSNIKVNDGCITVLKDGKLTLECDVYLNSNGNVEVKNVKVTLE